jgi:hypothetical protein
MSLDGPESYEDTSASMLDFDEANSLNSKGVKQEQNRFELQNFVPGVSDRQSRLILQAQSTRDSA